MIYFGIFYLLGYLLYSAMFAAVGAAFNSTTTPNIGPLSSSRR